MTKVKLSGTDRKISGVCGGIGEALGLDSNIVRVLFVLLTISFPAMFIIYFVVAMILPKTDITSEAIIVPKQFRLSTTNKKFLGVCGGLAEYFQVDATPIRVLFVVSILIFGFGLLPYFLLYILAK